MKRSNVYSCVLTNDEIKYINQYFDGSFSNYVHNSLKRDINLTKTNKIHNMLHDMTSSILMIGLGCIFLLFSMNTTNLAGYLILLLLSIFFIINGLTNILMEVHKKWKTVS